MSCIFYVRYWNILQELLKTFVFFNKLYTKKLCFKNLYSTHNKIDEGVHLGSSELKKKEEWNEVEQTQAAAM